MIVTIIPGETNKRIMMMRSPALIILFIFILTACTTTAASPHTRIRHHMEEDRKTEEEEEVAVLSLVVPRHVPKGEDAVLECHWRVPRLYSLKWYFNDRELFGWKPGETPSRVVHRLPGLNVDRARSTGRHLVLVGVGVRAGGRYKCEVIGEAPDFLTADRSDHMSIVHIPQDPPSIQGTQPQYKVGESVHLACVSPPSRPPTSLTWFINDRQAAAEYVAGLNSTRKWGEGLLESRAGLVFVLEPAHFDPHGQLRFRCAASIPGLYHKVRQHSIGGGTPLVLPPSPPSSAPPSSPALGGVNAPVMESRESSVGAAAALDGGSGVSRPLLPVMLLTLLTLLLSLPVS